MKLQSKEYQYFRMAILFSLILALLLAVFVFINGKDQSFLMINGRYSTKADYFFNYVTFLGDGLIWVPIFLYVLIFKRDFFLAVLAALIICTVLTHFGKRVIFVNEPRPLRLLEDMARAVPLMKGRDSYVNSFPSGHTSTAFTFALLLPYLVRRKFAVFVFPLIAFLVGYSRVYLAQHFATDVVAGIVVGIVSSYLALVIHDRYQKKKKQKELQSGP
jgi:membrane-associated phospholipid phosphatase